MPYGITGLERVKSDLRSTSHVQTHVQYEISFDGLITQICRYGSRQSIQDIQMELNYSFKKN